MSEKISLRLMECPTCGASLKVDNSTEVVDCVYCGNTFAPFFDRSDNGFRKTTGWGKSTVRIEGIKTPSSALAYLDIFFKEYDWDSFSFAQALTITEIDELANSLKSSSADDKNTWLVCFKAIAIPLYQKMKGCEKLLSSIAKEYQENDLNAYSKFDAYKRIVATILERKNENIAKLKEIREYAAKYDASPMEVASISSEIAAIEELMRALAVYENIQDIPQIQTIDQERNAQIIARLAEQGIDAEREYRHAQDLLARKKYVEALNTLLPLKGYADTRELIDKIDKFHFMKGVLEIEGVLYYFRNSANSYDASSLYPTKDGKIASSPIVTGIDKIITNYADVLYYVTSRGILTRYHLSKGTREILYKKTVDVKKVFVYDRRAFLWAKKIDNMGSATGVGDLIAVELATGKVSVILENVKQIVSLDGNKIVCKVKKTTDKDAYHFKVFTGVLDVDTMHYVDVDSDDVFVEGFADNCVIYTRYSPNEYNKKLYVKAMDSKEAGRLIEENIYQFCGIIAGKIFYYIGNAKNQTLIHINFDGTDRKEWPLHISQVLFEQGGWLYYIRKSGYNAILCKSRIDGTESCIIASNIEEFVQIKNGYLYYINDISSLIKVRMDGSNSQTLCTQVESVLSVRDDKIIFVSIDGKETYTSSYDETIKTKIVKSIYAVDFSGSGKIKLAYDVKEANYYDENTVYFIATQKIKNEESQQERVNVLYKLDVLTNHSEKLLVLQTIKEEKRLSGFAISMIIMALALCVSVVSFAAQEPGFGMFGMLGAFISLMTGLIIKGNADESQEGLNSK